MSSTQNKTDLARIIRERRSVKKGYNDKVVTEESVLELLEDAIWAPTHKLRQPWRFIFVNGENQADFAKKISLNYPEERQEDRENFLNEPSAFLIIVMDEPESQKEWDENFGATAAMIQNFWLLAWEQQLGVVWRTNPHVHTQYTKDVLGVKDTEKIVGFLHLGYFDRKPITKDRTPAVEKFSTYKA